MDITQYNNNKCEFKGNKLVEMIKSAKLLFERLNTNIVQYIYELGNLQIYFSQYNLEEDVMYDVLKDYFNQLAEYLYTTISNHLSMTVFVEGLGQLLIRPVVELQDGKIDYTTDIKYKNVCENSYNKCESMLVSQISKKYYHKDNLFRVNQSKNVATYDNMNIYENKEIDENSNEVITGYTLNFGRLKFIIRNANSIGGVNTERITSQDKIYALYEDIDYEIQNLSDMVKIIESNIFFLDRYLKKFTNKCNIKC